MADLLRVSLVGTMPSGEEWSVNPVFYIGGDFGEPITPLEAQTIAAAIAALALPSDLQNCMSTSTVWTGVRVEARTLDGTLEALGEAAKGSGGAGFSSTGHPFQTSIVFSLRTAVAGASGRGRMYWPATGVPLQIATLRPTTAFCASVAGTVSAFLAAISNAIEVTIDGSAGPAVWSRKLNTLNPVIAVQVGDILDVQRRRRDALIEGVSSSPYTG